MLGLRLVLLGAHFGYFVLAFKGPHWAGLFWNAVFIVINGYHVARILHDRRAIKFPPALEDIYRSVFSDMKRSDFEAFWKAGETVTARDAVILREGEIPRRLGLVFRGRVIVLKGDAILNELGKGRFFAEMGYITRKSASATLKVAEESNLRIWSYDAIDRFSKKHPDIWHVVLGVIGRDMAIKIAEQNPR